MQKPNIIYILADDMGYGDLSCLNENAAFTTPHLDKMCQEGMYHTDAHSTSALCTPSRYSLMTGRYNWRSSLKEGVLFGYDTPLIEKSRPTIGSFLQSQGYKTACIGKWHLGFQWPLTDSNNPESIDFSLPLLDAPVDHGFDYFYGICGSLDMPPYVYVENRRVTAMPDRISKCHTRLPIELTKHFFRDGLTGADFEHSDVLPNLTRRVLSQIDQWQDEPFFLYFPMTAPHAPMLPTEEFIGKSGTNLYGDFVLMCDDIVGQINQKLKDLGLVENTIVIFASDNGCAPMANFAELAQFGHHPSYIFRGHKADIYEGGHRIPYIIKWPDKIKPGTHSDEPVLLSDLYATCMDLLDVAPETDQAPDSRSNLDLWLNQHRDAPIHEALIHHSLNGSFSIRKGPWKLEMCPDSGGWSAPKPGSLPNNCHPIQLYNLDDDIREQYNIYEHYPDIVNELKEALYAIVGDDGDPHYGMKK